MKNVNSPVFSRRLLASLLLLLVLSIFSPTVRAPSVGYQNVSELYLHTYSIQVGGVSYRLADFLTSSVNQSKTALTQIGGMGLTWISPTVSGAIGGGDWNLTIFYRSSTATQLAIDVSATDISGNVLLVLFSGPPHALPASNGAPMTIPLGSLTPAIALTAYRIEIYLLGPFGGLTIDLDSPLAPSRLNLPFLTLDSVYPPASQTSTSVPSLTLVSLAAALITVSAIAALTILRKSSRLP